MRDARRNYVVVGAFVLAMVAALVVWIALLSGWTGATDAYHIHYGRVLNLAPGTQVHYEGFPVGRVEAIGPETGDPRGGFRVDVVVERGWPIPEDSLAVVTTGGVLSAVIIDIQSGRSPSLLEPGGEIPGREQDNVFAALSSTASRVSDLATSLQPFLEKVGEEGPPIIENLRSFTRELQQTAEQLNEALGPDTVASAKNTLANFEASSDQLRALSEGVGGTLEDLDGLLGDVRGMLAQDDGELGHALVDLHESLEAVARHVESIARNLETTSRNMAEFSRQIREHPNVLLTGREQDDGSGP